jgi:hypothetical protein
VPEALVQAFGQVLFQRALQQAQPQQALGQGLHRGQVAASYGTPGLAWASAAACASPPGRAARCSALKRPFTGKVRVMSLA